MKNIIKLTLRILRRKPFMRLIFLNIMWWLFLLVPLPIHVRDILMWDIATYILGVDFETIVKLKSGLRLSVGMDDNVSRTILFFSRVEGFLWEPDTLRLALSVQPQYGTTLIAGGHIGYLALHLAKNLMHKGRVIAFEPVEKFYKRLTRNSELSNIENIVIERAALDRESCLDVPLYVLDAHSSLDQRIASKNSSIEKVTVYALDDYLQKNDIDEIDLLLLDVEGKEKDVLLDAKNLLKKKPDLILEVNLRDLEKRNETENDLYHFLYQLGYSVL